MAIADAPYRPLPIRVPKLSVERRADGSMILTTDQVLPAQHRSLFHLFQDRARAHPGRTFMARRQALPGGGWGDWIRVSFADGVAASRSIAQALIDRGLGPDRSVMVISGASLEHGLLSMGAQAARACFTPVSTGYSLLSGDFRKLRHVFDVCRPRLIFADDGARYGPALKSLPLDGVEVVTVTPAPGLDATPFHDLTQVAATSAVDTSIEQITHATVAKTVFTSGSTGPPKGVIVTHGMMTAVVAQHDAIFINDHAPDEEPGGQLSWIPWSHMGGATIRFCDTINDMTGLYIDEGRPLPGEFDECMRNLREMSLTEFSSPPAIFNFLVPAMEADPALRDTFFARLRSITYGTAALPQDMFARLQALSVAATGFKTPITTKYGSTETQGVTIAPWPLESLGPIGLPFPGLTLKLAPVGDRLEMRVKGDAVTKGYLNNPEATAKAFDEEGFFRTGDAARFVDPDDPSKGLALDGRTAENFKLTSGTWVSVGQVRAALNAALGVTMDVIIAGHDRNDIRALAWLRPVEAAALAGASAAAPTADLASHHAVLAALTRRLAAYNATAGGSSRRVTKLMVLVEPPHPDEVADKGSISQRLTLDRRADKVAALYEDAEGSATVVFG